MIQPSNVKPPTSVRVKSGWKSYDTPIKCTENPVPTKCTCSKGWEDPIALFRVDPDNELSFKNVTSMYTMMQKPCTITHTCEKPNYPEKKFKFGHYDELPRTGVFFGEPTMSTSGEEWYVKKCSKA